MGGEPRDFDSQQLARIYRNRFSDEELAFKRDAWKILCRVIFQRYVGADDTVVDLGAGQCEFLHGISCGEKIAVDLNPEVARYAQGARFVQAPSTDIAPIPDGTIDVVFSSNFFEHLKDKAAVLKTFQECARILRPGGRLIVLMPNIRYLPGRYWDFFDHQTPLSHLSLVEGLSMCGFTPLRVTPRFLPYSVAQSSVPRSLIALRLYLRLPFTWPLFGRQMLVVATSPIQHSAGLS